MYSHISQSLCLAEIVLNASYFEGANQKSRLKPKQKFVWRGQTYSPVQSCKAETCCVYTDITGGEGSREKGSPTLTSIKLLSFLPYKSTSPRALPSPLDSLCWLSGSKRRWRDGGRGGERKPERQDDEDGRSERITVKLRRGGLRGSCRGGRITFRSRGRGLSRLLWQLCSPALPLASCLLSFHWQD